MGEQKWMLSGENIQVKMLLRYLQTQILLKKLLQPSDDGCLFITPVAATAKSRHCRKYLVDVGAGGPDLTIPETALNELFSTDRLGMHY
mgnify:CR=1 FL=1